MKNKKILHYFLLTIMKVTMTSSKSYCNNQKECIVLHDYLGHDDTGLVTLKCILTDKSRLRFNKSFEKIIGGEKCEKINLNGVNKLLLRPKNEGSIRVEKGMIDLVDFVWFEHMFNLTILAFEIQPFKGFELNVSEISIDNDKFWQTNSISLQ